MSTDPRSDLEPAAAAGPRSNGISAVEEPRLDLVVRHWRIIIIAAAFVLPIVSIALEQATTAFPDSGFGATYLRLLRVPRDRVMPFDGGTFFLDLFLSPLIALEFNWPFIVLAVRTKRHISRYWPHADRARAAMVGASLAGLIPYAFFYAYLPLDSLLHGGAGVSLMGPLLVWPVGWFFTFAGARVVDFFAG